MTLLLNQLNELVDAGEAYRRDTTNISTTDLIDLQLARAIMAADAAAEGENHENRASDALWYFAYAAYLLAGNHTDIDPYKTERKMLAWARKALR